ncbi:hypothetical protein ON010_g9282 [Phytophthora cinnamomi]|nr:hypothetical protein ON010_g9282 [Phytophthora cinnamomi]
MGSRDMEEGASAVGKDEEVGAAVVDSEGASQAENVAEVPEDGDGQAARPAELTGSSAPRRAERMTGFLKGYKHTRAWASSRKIVCRCSKYRASCCGKMEFTIASMDYSSVRAHTCSETVVASSGANVEAEVKAQTDLFAIEHVAWPVRHVWEEHQRRYYSAGTPDVHDQVERGIKKMGRVLYFERTWLEQYSIDVWNVFGLDNELIARTNIPLERFNRELNSRFPTPHSSVATFVTVIKTISHEYVRRFANVPRGRGRSRRVASEVIQLPGAIDIPTDEEMAEEFTCLIRIPDREQDQVGIRTKINSSDYIASFFHVLAMADAESSEGFDDMAGEAATPGGLNEQAALCCSASGEVHEVERKGMPGSSDAGKMLWLMQKTGVLSTTFKPSTTPKTAQLSNGSN